MAEELAVAIRLANQKVRFSGSARSNPAITMDYFPPLGDGEGYTGLELLLMSLAACSASTVVPLLRRMKKSVADFQVQARGIRRERHPTVFEKIFLEFILVSPDATENDLRQAIQMSEETFCPVWAMLKNSAAISYVCKANPA
jgi:putative redox protein